jgi:3-phenylpropionate/cinnamic acid dioxygenase small subunit
VNRNAVELATELLYREAFLLDNQRWDEWLALFSDDAEFWVPAWKGEHQPTDNPKREVSLIYYASRAGLEDRVWRARSGKSVASLVLPRTQHAITNILLDAHATQDAMRVFSNWTVQQFLIKDKSVETHFGRYEHTLVAQESTWRITKKKIILFNDYLPAKLDFYNL